MTVVSSPSTDLRLAVAAALNQITEAGSGDWVVLDAPVDNLAPPAYMIQWGPDPWRTVDTVCTDLAQLEVIAVAGRIGPENNYPTLETMVDHATAALVTARLRPYQTLAPAPLEIAQLTYLTARIQIRQPVATGGT